MWIELNGPKPLSISKQFFVFYLEYLRVRSSSMFHLFSIRGNFDDLFCYSKSLFFLVLNKGFDEYLGLFLVS